MTPAKELNSTVFCKIAPSPIHGVGVFAIRDIPAGTKITNHTVWSTDNVKWYEMTPEEFAEVLPAIRHLILDRMLYDESDQVLRFISPNRDQILQSFMNHSDTPNTDGVYAIWDISEGEELTEDFNLLFAKPHPLTAQKMQGIIKTV